MLDDEWIDITFSLVDRARLQTAIDGLDAYIDGIVAARSTGIFNALTAAQTLVSNISVTEGPEGPEGDKGPDGPPGTGAVADTDLSQFSGIYDLETDVGILTRDAVTLVGNSMTREEIDQIVVLSGSLSTLQANYDEVMRKIGIGGTDIGTVEYSMVALESAISRYTVNQDAIISFGQSLFDAVYPVGSIKYTYFAVPPQRGIWNLNGTDRISFGIGGPFASVGITNAPSNDRIRLTSAQSGLRSHKQVLEYGRGHVAIGDRPGGGSKASSTVQTSIAIAGADAENSHENMPPYIVRYRWRREG
jgi:hypothetical protein